MTELERLRALLKAGRVKLGVHIRKMNSPGSPVYRSLENVLPAAAILTAAFAATKLVHFYLGAAVLAVACWWWLTRWLPKVKDGVFERTSALVLLDDFSASGTSCLTADGGKPKGKVAKFIDRIQSSEVWKAVVSFPKTRLVIVLYVATEQALANMHAGAEALKKAHGIETTVLAVQRIASNVSLKPSDTDPMIAVIKNEKYYDASVEDEHTKKGNSDLKFGFAAGGLPLVLHHNTPNNSIFLLWVEGSETVRPLFPRVSRHRREA